jgi:exo-1,4-beta-D-glucosaminidase
VPGTLTTFDWGQTDYTHTPALRHEDLTAMASLPQAQVNATAAIAQTGHGRELRIELKNASATLAFQVRAAARTTSGGLIAPVLWSDNWIELAPGESTTLTAILPADAPESPSIRVEGWNIAPIAIAPQAAAAASKGK